MTKKFKTMVELMFGNFKYDRILQFDGRDVTVAVLKGKSGLIDFAGNLVTEFIYDDLSEEFYDDIGYDLGWINFPLNNNKYCSMRLNNRWGLIDKKGNVVVDFKYSNPVKEWGENFIIETDKNEGKSFIMDSKNTIHVDLNFDFIEPRSNYAIVTKDDKDGIIDANLQTLIPCEYDFLNFDDKNKYIRASKNGKVGIIDLKENIILDFIYEDIDIEKFYGNYIFRVYFNDKYALFNEKGERIA